MPLHSRNTTIRWRRLVDAALLLILATGAASAQTITVTRATPGAAIEVWVNGTKVQSAAAGADGVVSVGLSLPARARSDEMDVHLAVDTCGDAVRIQLYEAGFELPATECARANIDGLYVMRKVTTFVVDLSGSTPDVWLTQGRAPKAWLNPVPTESGEGRTWAPLPKGLVASAGGGFGMFGNTVTRACGTVSNCSGHDFRGALNAGATFWISRALGAEVGFLKPGNVDVSGSDTGYRFTTKQTVDILTIAGKVGIAAGPARIYALGGAAYHWASWTTSESTDSTTITVNGVTTTLAGGSQNLGITAPGWGWLAGGGAEFWIRQPFGIYVEGGYMPLKGADKNGGEARIDDHLIYFVAGLRLHVGR